MIKGIIVYNRADAEYNKWFIEHLISEGKSQGLLLELKVTGNADSAEDDWDSLISDDVSFAVMRNRDYRMSEYLEDHDVRCFNSSMVCRLGNDKWDMYRKFCDARIPVMYTQKTKLPYPFVMKPRSGHGGQDVYLINNADDYERVKAALTEEQLGDFIYQMVASERGRDIRVYVVGNTILTAMERTANNSESDFRANFSLGGGAEEHALSDEELKLAARAAKYLRADFIGIDLIYNNGKPVINEIEDAVGTRMLYANTDIDAVKEYISWIKSCVMDEA